MGGDRDLRRPPDEAVLFLVLVVVDLATITLGLTEPTLVSVVDGYVLLLPPFVALVVPVGHEAPRRLDRRPCHSRARVHGGHVDTDELTALGNRLALTPASVWSGRGSSDMAIQVV